MTPYFEELDKIGLNALLGHAGDVPARVRATVGPGVPENEGQPNLRAGVPKRVLLEYDAGERQWAWDKNHVGAVDMTGNVLHLFFSKRSGLSETTQSALKAVVCIGVINELVIGHLSNTVIL